MSDLKDRRARWSLVLSVAIPALDITAESVLATSERRGRTNRKDSAPTIAGDCEVLSVKAGVLFWLGKSYIYRHRGATNVFVTL